MSFTSLKLLAEMIIQKIMMSIQEQRALPVMSQRDGLKITVGQRTMSGENDHFFGQTFQLAGYLSSDK